jgi:hypothetical protein
MISAAKVGDSVQNFEFIWLIHRGVKSDVGFGCAALGKSLTVSMLADQALIAFATPWSYAKAVVRRAAKMKW